MKSTLNIPWKDSCWSWSSNTCPPDVKSWLTGKDLDAEKDWKAGGKGDNRGWDGWMASLAQWTWIWTNSGRWWRTGKPGMLQSMGLQRVRHDLATDEVVEQQRLKLEQGLCSESGLRPKLNRDHAKSQSWVMLTLKLIGGVRCQSKPCFSYHATS